MVYHITVPPLMLPHFGFLGNLTVPFRWSCPSKLPLLYSTWIAQQLGQREHLLEERMLCYRVQRVLTLAHDVNQRGLGRGTVRFERSVALWEYLSPHAPVTPPVRHVEHSIPAEHQSLSVQLKSFRDGRGRGLVRTGSTHPVSSGCLRRTPRSER